MISILDSPERMRSFAEEQRRGGLGIGFVPTMGALHEGHLSLVRESARAASRTVVSIFVNPLQFGPKEDFARYPRDLEGDVALLRGAGVDAVFAPALESFYPPGFSTYVVQEGTTAELCGAARPGHFRGVTTVVTKLFNLVDPDLAFFGQKDAQQAGIIRRMARDLSMRVKVVVCPTVRESDGLAMSSRNRYLSAEERAQATVLHRALKKAAGLFAAGERRSSALTEAMAAMICEAPLARVEYVSVVHPGTFAPLETIADRALAALAVRFGETRLIDNTLLPEGAPLDWLGGE